MGVQQGPLPILSVFKCLTLDVLCPLPSINSQPRSRPASSYSSLGFPLPTEPGHTHDWIAFHTSSPSSR